MRQQQQRDAVACPRENSVGIDFVPEPSGAADQMPWPPADSPSQTSSRTLSQTPSQTSGHTPGHTPSQTSPEADSSGRSTIVLDSFGGWQDFELLPPSYRSRRHAEQAFHKWSGVLLVLLSITVGSSIALWMRGRRLIAKNADLVTQSAPIAELRRKTQLLEAENAVLEKWCSWVESAKPDDSVAQVMGAVTLATHPGPALPQQQHLDVQSIEIKLPLEYDASLKEPPNWAASRFTLTVMANSRDVLMPWNDRLEKSGRLKDVALTTPGGAWREALIRVTAQPLSSRLVP
ncbi:hypothetical protein Mal15_37610 [Stieleria maiorica]|uniref:Uncharacterized protein n=1 Tax=Stieleria maiorica TaxID=2795974 RepID=A0A5B9MJB3_9BACT|nr:hypothetical protein [Stieleria maiorica]QEF99695.1 hypothetical protein Mal15_37610 [Stieleria maiorica]